MVTSQLVRLSVVVDRAAALAGVIVLTPGADRAHAVLVAKGPQHEMLIIFGVWWR